MKIQENNSQSFGMKLRFANSATWHLDYNQKNAVLKAQDAFKSFLPDADVFVRVKDDQPELVLLTGDLPNHKKEIAIIEPIDICRPRLTEPAIKFYDSLIESGKRIAQRYLQPEQEVGNAKLLNLIENV